MYLEELLKEIKQEFTYDSNLQIDYSFSVKNEIVSQK